jgi:hypothetical protein
MAPSSGLSDVLRLLTQDNLDYLLNSSDSLSSWYGIANQLPFLLSGGLECRLLDNQSRIDLQHYIATDSLDLLKLYEYASYQRNPTWRALHDFLTRYLNNQLLLRPSLVELWLEYDQHNPLSPLVFLGLTQQPHEAQVIYPALVGALTHLSATSSAVPDYAYLHHCVSACPSDAFISHIGLLQSRRESGLRINVKRLSDTGLSDYLRALRWPYDVKPLCCLFAQLLTMLDRVTVCLDVSDTISGRVGLECILSQQPENDPRWSQWMHFLLQKKLCDEQKAEDLLAWPQQITPARSSVPWPDSLILDSLAQPMECFSVFERRLSHIKLIWQPDRPLSAKAYLWFGHRWWTPE